MILQSHSWDISRQNYNPKRYDTCTPVFTAALFIIAKTQKQPKCLLTDEWIKTMWYQAGYYSVVKREWNNAVCSNKDDLGMVILGEESQKEEERCHMVSLTCGSKQNK